MVSYVLGCTQTTLVEKIRIIPSKSCVTDIESGQMYEWKEEEVHLFLNILQTIALAKKKNWQTKSWTPDGKNCT